VDPPRRGGPMDPRWSPASFQPRRVVSRADPRPSLVPQGGDRETKGLWRATSRGLFTVRIARLPCPQASRLRMAPHCGHPRSQRSLANKEDKDGNHAVPSSYSQAGRPPGQLRLEERLLLLGHRPQGQRGLHNKPKRAAAAVLRTANGMEPQPHCFSKSHISVYIPPTGPRVLNPFSLGTLSYSHKVGTQ
jgi:hypothetical protein